MFCRRESDGLDWYTHVNAEGSFAAETVKCTIYQNRVLAATTDVTRLFPPACTVVEIAGYTGSDPQEDFGGKVYDPAAGTFTTPPPPVPLKTSKLGLKRALDEIGQWTAAKAAIASNASVQEEWDLAIEINRHDPLTQLVITALNLTAPEVDALIIRANELAA